MIRWRRYFCRIAATATAAVVVQACGFAAVDDVTAASENEVPAALALMPDSDPDPTDSTARLSSRVVDVPSTHDPNGADDSGDVQPEVGRLGDSLFESEVSFDPSANNLAGLESSLGLYPLTGRPAANTESAERPVLMMKIDNHPRARPQIGLHLADMVFDLRAEGVTRFAAVFQSAVPNPVGPVRSSRTSDFDLLRGFDRPLYGSSGGNANVAAGLRRLPIVELTNLTRREYFRNGSRPAPHNLVVNASDLYALAPDDIAAPEPWFALGPEGRLPASDATAVEGAVTVSFRGSPIVTHTWDEARKGWLRTQDGRPHNVVDVITDQEVQLAPENVVIMVTDYQSSSADLRSPEVRSTGRGPLVVLTDGNAVVGTWQRETASDHLALLDRAGDEIVLTRGRTWILMPEQGQVSFADGDRPAGWQP